MNKEKVVALLYILLRDDIVFGRMNQIFKEHIDVLDGQKLNFTCKAIEDLARSLVEKL